MRCLLSFFLISVLVIYPTIQSFAEEINVPEPPGEILTFDFCHDRPNLVSPLNLVSNYVFQGPITYSNVVNKPMDNYDEKKVYIKISNFEYLLDPAKNITKGYISIVQPNASSFNSINIHNTYTMCTKYLDNKPEKETLAYIEPLHLSIIDECDIKEINLKGTTHINPVIKIASEPKNFKLQLSGIPNNNATTVEENYLKEIKGLLKIGSSSEASSNNIVMDISCINS